MRELKTYVHTKKPAHGFYSSFFHNCQNLEATKMSLVGEFMTTLWYIQTMEYYSTLRERSYGAMARHRGNVNVYYNI
jgi:hypothetical protein